MYFQSSHIHLKSFYLEDILQAKLNLLAMLFFHDPVQEYIFFRTLINIIFIKEMENEPCQH